MSTLNKNNNQDDQTKANFQVCVRIRPLNSKEENQTTRKYHSIVKAQDDMVFVYDPNENSIKDILQYNQSSFIPSNNPSLVGGQQGSNNVLGINNNVNNITKKPEKEFIFDKVFDENASTEQVFQEAIYPTVDHITSGYNSTVFAYGMTGAGKSYTIFGNLYSQTNQQDGLALMIIQSLHKQAKETTSQIKFKFSYLEIYNENIRDLMVPKSENLMVIEDPEKGVFVPDLTEYPLEDPQDINNFIIQGNTRRIMASTAANQFSSRSHAIIQIICEQVNHGQNKKTQSKLCIVDLAGSERAASTENRGMRLTEGANINRSLLALGNCINLLSDSNKKGSFVPYRDSKLTRLLKESLGGNTKSIMVACISPSSLCYEETINTLKYAVRARKIKKSVTKNEQEMTEHVSQYKSIVNGLRQEIINLKTQLDMKNKENILLKNKQRLIHQYNSNNSVEGLDENNFVDEIGQKLFENLEEHWEIKNTIEEIINLNRISENYIVEQEKMLELHLDQIDDLEVNEIKSDIHKRKEVIQSNQEILAEMNLKLAKNIEQKKELQVSIKNLGNQYQGTQTFNSSMAIGGIFGGDMESDLKDFDANMKDIQILEMQKKMQQMQEQLNQKDKLLQQKQKLIMDLKTGKENQQSSSSSSLSQLSGQQSLLQKKGSQIYGANNSNNIPPSPSVNSQTGSTSSNPRKFYMKIPKEMISDRSITNKEINTPLSLVVNGNQIQDANKFQQNNSGVFPNSSNISSQASNNNNKQIKRQTSININQNANQNDENSYLATTKRTNRESNNKMQYSQLQQNNQQGANKEKDLATKRPSTSKHINFPTKQVSKDSQSTLQQLQIQINGFKPIAKQTSNQKNKNNGSNVLANNNAILNGIQNSSGKKMEISISELKQYAQKLKNVDFSNITKNSSEYQEATKQKPQLNDNIENYQIVESRSQADLLQQLNFTNILQENQDEQNDKKMSKNASTTSFTQAKKDTSSKANSPKQKHRVPEDSFNVEFLVNQMNKKAELMIAAQQMKTLDSIIQQELTKQESTNNLINFSTSQNTVDNTTAQNQEKHTLNEQQQKGIVKSKANRSMSCFKMGGQDLELNSYAFARKKVRELKDRLAKMAENIDKYSKEEVQGLLKEYKMQNNYQLKNPEDEQKIKILENHIGLTSQKQQKQENNENLQPQIVNKKPGTYSSHQSSSATSSYVQQQQMKMLKKEQNQNNACLKGLSTNNINNANQLPPTPTSNNQNLQNASSNTSSSNIAKSKKVLPRGLLSQLNSNYAETVTYSKKISANQSSFHQPSSRNTIRDKSPISTKNRDNSRKRLQDSFGQAQQQVQMNSNIGIPPKSKQALGLRDQHQNFQSLQNQENQAQI
ncbi:kinesin motor catalytic domain protein (macronuclear) [Tetrahymena thermophila SB210]|uniref:Kinesin motor catalytic domain protein n=1 Tax=Tetrahymena thermophila (strain SB210) TaxID=312017 RepID=I7M3E3_TETTS|nr:kinesin motor catalytic domain protein [Tetrahymena thermophila SB210]EAS02983.2 kinesin motor catalytic domain protein [Tetrahymena thermophila SB210]|eukprot:XP_001023228.2 kinesin motor catalytic domain protein [Tetrahymena thermophila SB210]